MNGGNHNYAIMAVGIDAQMMYVQITGWGALDNLLVGLNVSAQQGSVRKSGRRWATCILAGTNYIEFTGIFAGSCKQ